ncbi:MAG: ABC transporter substrate-binding protein [Dehalococcoidia bacterium]|nr:ABC transporter substrate-binding protein [Dehalococcoidia bacterium]
MGSRWLLPAILAFSVAALGGLWYTASHPPRIREPAAAGVYIEGTAGAPSRVNPLFAPLNAVDTDLASLVFSGLTRLGPKGDVLPGLAESWDISANNKTYTFHLRRGVTWHDGHPFTADDVVFTVGLLQDPEYRGPSFLADLFRSVSVEKLDDSTVDITLAQPFAPFLAYASIGLLPEHLLKGLSAEDLYNAPFNQQPVGTGPFRLLEMTKERAVLESVPGHYLGEPAIGHLEMRFFLNEPRLLLALREGEIDGAFFRSPLSIEDKLYLQNEKRWQVHDLTSTTYTILYLNNSSPLFADERVRQALALAIDKEKIIANFLDGQAVRADSPIPAGTWAYYPALERYDFDVFEASRLLDEAGWQLNIFGIREKAGQAMEFDLVTNEERSRIAIAEELARSWAILGVKATVRTQKATVLLRETLMPRNFNAAIYGFDAGLDPDPYPTWHSTQIGGEKGNLAGFVDAQADEVLEDGRLTDDPTRRSALYRVFQEIFARNVPSVPLFHNTYTYVTDDRFRPAEAPVLFDSGSRFSAILGLPASGR